MMAAARRREQKPQRPTGSRPGMDGRYEEGEREITGPQEVIAGERVGSPPRKYKVTVNVRESAIDHMASRGRLDETQHTAADRFRKMWELAAIGRSRGINFDSAYSGAVGDPFTDELIQAGRILARTIRRLGLIRARILVAVVGEGKLIEEVAREWSDSSGRLKGKRAEGYVTGTLVDAIDDLVDIWRLEAKGQPERKREYYYFNGNKVDVFDAVRASGPMNYTGPAREISIGKFGDTLIEEKRPSEQQRGQTSGNVGSKRRGK